MKHITLALCSLLLLAPACDSSAENGDEQLRDAQADADGPRHHRGPAKMLEHLCDAVDCSDAQAEQLATLAAEAMARPEHSEQERAEKQASHEALAVAFRAETLDVDAFAAAEANHRARHATRLPKLAAAAVQAHGILSAEQRQTAATMLEGLVSARSGRSDRFAQRGAGHLAQRLCRIAECRDAQQEQIKAALVDAAPTPNAEQIAAVAKDAVALITAQDVSEADVLAVAGRAEALKGAHKPDLATVASEVHSVLDSEQRSAIADVLAEKGPRGLLGGRKGGHRKGGHRKGGHGKDHHGEDQPVAG